MIVINMLHDNLLALPIKNAHIDDTIIQELKEYQNNCKAVYFHAVNLFRKAWRAIREEKDNSLQLAYYFGKIAEGVAQTRADKIRQNMIKKAFISMRARLHAKKMRKSKKQFALQRSHINKLKKVFREWLFVNALQSSTKSLSKLRLVGSFNESMMLLRQNKERRKINRLSTISQYQVMHSFHANSLKKVTFRSLLLNLKMNKVQSMLKITNFINFKHNLIIYNKDSKKFYQYRIKKLFSSCFSTWKNSCKESMAVKFRRLYTLARCLQSWRDNLQYLISERELQRENDSIVAIFRDKKQKQHLLRFIYGWRQQVLQIKDLRVQNSIVNKFAGLKYREIVLRRYFEMLKANCINRKIKSHFYYLKLKRKVVDGLKIAICQSLQKGERIISFMEKLQRKKYFERIVRFNKEQRAKVERFKLSKMFTGFSLSIVYDYYHKSSKATAYHQRNLLYKGMFALKNQVSYSKKTSFCIIYLNVIRPLRRWTQGHRAANYQREREWLLLKKIFRQWRLLIVRASSAKKLTKQFSIEDSIKPIKDDSKMEAFEFDNIMATIAKIRKNFVTEKQEAQKNESGLWVAVQTPSQELEFSISRQNLAQGGYL